MRKGYIKKIDSMRELRELLCAEYNLLDYLPDQCIGHAFILLNMACKRDKRLDDLRWNICNGSGIKSHDKEAFKRGAYYTCTISGRTMGSKTIWAEGETASHAITKAVGLLRGYTVDE